MTESTNGQVISAVGQTLTDYLGQTWSLVQSSSNGVQAYINGSIQPDPNNKNVQRIKYYCHQCYMQNTGGSWFVSSIFDGLEFNSFGGDPYTVYGTPTTKKTRDYWENPGGNKSVYVTPLGDAATWSSSTDSDTQDLRHGGFINTFYNYGIGKWVSFSTSDPTGSFISGQNPNLSSESQAAGITITPHVPQGAQAPQSSAVDEPFGIVDTNSYPGMYWNFGPVSALAYPNSGFYQGFTYQDSYGNTFGWADARTDRLGNEQDYGIMTYDKMIGAITDYDLDPTQNPNFPMIQHMIQFMHDLTWLKATCAYQTVGPLSGDVWPRNDCDYQGPGSGNNYIGNLKYGSTIGIPKTTTRPKGMTQIGQMLWWAYQNYGGFIRDQGTGGMVMVSTKQASDKFGSTLDNCNNSNELRNLLVPNLCILRNQHQKGQSFTTNPINGPGNRMDKLGAPPLTQTVGVTPTVDGGYVKSGSTISITDNIGQLWTITSANKVAVNGVTDQGTANVSQIVWAGGGVWHQNTSGSWYWWTGTPVLGWFPPGGTSNSPYTRFVLTATAAGPTVIPKPPMPTTSPPSIVSYPATPPATVTIPAKAGPPSAVLAVTIPGTVPAAVTGLTVETTTATSVTIGWTAETAGTGVRVYELDYQQANTTAWTVWGGVPILDTATELAATGIYEVTVNNLNSGTTYNFRVRAINNAGSGQPSSVVSATTTGSGTSAPNATTWNPQDQYKATIDAATNLIATGGNGSVSFVRSTTSASAGKLVASVVVNTTSADLAFGIASAQFAANATTASTPYITPGSGSFTDAAGNVYTIDSGGNAKENGQYMNNGGGTGAMEYYNATVYAQDGSTKSWYTWNGADFVGASPPPAPTTTTSVPQLGTNTLGAGVYVGKNPQYLACNGSNTSAPGVGTVSAGDEIVIAIDFTNINAVQMWWTNKAMIASVGTGAWNGKICTPFVSGGITLTGLTGSPFSLCYTDDLGGSVTLHTGSDVGAVAGVSIPTGGQPWDGTKTAVPPGRVNSIAATMGVSSAALTWPTVSGAAVYRVNVSLSGKNNWFSGGWARGGSAAVQGLLGGTAYDFTITASNASGDGPTSTVATFSTTTPTTSLLRLRGLNCKASVLTSAGFSGMQTDVPNANAVIVPVVISTASQTSTDVQLDATLATTAAWVTAATGAGYTVYLALYLSCRDGSNPNTITPGPSLAGVATFFANLSSIATQAAQTGQTSGAAGLFVGVELAPWAGLAHSDLGPFTPAHMVQWESVYLACKAAWPTGTISYIASLSAMALQSPASDWVMKWWFWDAVAFTVFPNVPSANTSKAQIETYLDSKTDTSASITAATGGRSVFAALDAYAQALGRKIIIGACGIVPATGNQAGPAKPIVTPPPYDYTLGTNWWQAIGDEIAKHVGSIDGIFAFSGSVSGATGTNYTADYYGIRGYNAASSLDAAYLGLNGTGTTTALVAPTNISASNVTSTSITLSWSAVLGTNITYLAQISTDKSTWTALPATSNLNVTFSGENPATTYYLRVQAQSGAVVSAWSPIVSATTPSSFTSRTWTQQPGADGNIWNEPLHDGATWSASTAAMTTALVSGSPAIYAKSFPGAAIAVGSASDPLITIVSSGASQRDVSMIAQCHIPVGTQSSNGRLTVMDSTQPYRIWSFTGLMTDGSSITASTTTLNCSNAEVDDASGYMEDQTTGNFGYDQGVGALRAWELNSAVNLAGAIQHSLAFTCPATMLRAPQAWNDTKTQMSDGTPSIMWPATHTDSNATTTYTGKIPPGCTIGIPQSDTPPTGWPTGPMMLYNCARNFGFVHRGTAGAGVTLNTEPSAEGNALLSDMRSYLPQILSRCRVLTNQLGTTSRKGPGNRVASAPPSINVSAPSNFITLNAIPNILNGSVFFVTGSLVGYSAAPTLQMVDDNGTAQALPSGAVVTATQYKFLHPSMGTGNHTLKIQDSAKTSVSASVSYVVPPVIPYVPGNTTSTATGGGPLAAGLLNFLTSIQGKNSVSMQYIGVGSDPTYGYAAIQTVQTKTGQLLGGICGDYWAPGSTLLTATTTFNTYAKQHWQAGGIVMLALSMPNPTTGKSFADTSSLDATGILQSGSTTNTNFNTILDSVAAALLDLQNAGVPVILRLMMRNNDVVGWTGISTLNNAQFLAVWQYAHDRLVKTKGLTNIVFLDDLNAGVANLLNTGAPRDTMLSWLTGLVGKGTICVQQLLGQSTDDGTQGGMAVVVNATGKHPGGLGGNYYNNDGNASIAGGQSYAAVNWQTPNSALISHWNAGGLVLLSGFMWPSPNLPHPGGPADTGIQGSVNAADLVTPGTATYNNWLVTLDDVAAGMQNLVDNGVAVILFRPLHEMQGNWFWWGTSYLSDAQYIQLWKITYNYLCNTKGLKNNLIWIYSCCTGPAGSGNARYPGDAYVDIAGWDDYTNDPASSIAADASVVQNINKPRAYCEWGPSSPGVDETVIVKAIKNTSNPPIYWEQWSVPGWAISLQTNLSAALNDPYVLMRENLGRPTFGGTGATQAASRIPGSAYVDMLGLNLYSNAPASAINNYTALVNQKLPVALSEFGPNTATSGDATFQEATLVNAIKNTLPNFVLWDQWWDSNAGKTGWGMASTYNVANGDWSYVKSALTNPWVLNAGQLSITTTPGGTIQNGASANGSSIQAGSTEALYDSSGNAWTITSSKQVAQNGTADTTTSNVAVLAYVDGKIWQENTANDWYSYSSPGNWPGPVTASPLLNISGVTGGGGNKTLHPLSSATTGSWKMGVQNGMYYWYLMPSGYDPTYVYPTLLYLHQNDQGQPFYNNLNGGGSLAAAQSQDMGTDGGGGYVFPQINSWFNNVTFRQNYPCIVIAPLCNQTADTSGNTVNWGGVSSGTQASETAIMAVLDQFASTYSTDKANMLITGNSMGGMGCWDYTIKYNNQTGTVGKRFCGSLAMAGATYCYGFPTPLSSVITALTNVPIFAIHGGQDQQVPLSWDENMYKAYGGTTYNGSKSPNGQMCYLEDAALSHDVWDVYYALPKAKPYFDWLFGWFFSK